MDVIKFEDCLHAETVFFFGKSIMNGEERLFRDCANCYTTQLRGKYIIVDRNLKKQFPEYCYIRIKTAVDKGKCFIITDAELISPKETTKEQVHANRSRLTSRPEYAIEDTIKYYNAKSILGNIDCLVVTYKMKGYKQTFFDCHLNCGGRIFTTESPSYIYKYDDKADDYSRIYFKEFKEIDMSGFERFRVVNEDLCTRERKDIIEEYGSLEEAKKCQLDNYFFNTSIEHWVNKKWSLVAINGEMVKNS